MIFDYLHFNENLFFNNIARNITTIPVVNIRNISKIKQNHKDALEQILELYFQIHENDHFLKAKKNNRNPFLWSFNPKKKLYNPRINGVLFPELILSNQKENHYINLGGDANIGFWGNILFIKGDNLLFSQDTQTYQTLLIPSKVHLKTFR